LEGVSRRNLKCPILGTQTFRVHMFGRVHSNPSVTLGGMTKNEN
jgi:hypothetical protein